MSALLGAVMVSSLLGSMHCAGMCGGFVALCGAATPSGGSARLAQVAYNLGRFIAYVTLGALAGSIGAAFDSGGAIAGLERLSAWMAAGLLLAMALVQLWPTAWTRAGGGRIASWSRRTLAPVMRRLTAMPAPLRGLTIGLSSALLPCGWLYLFVLLAAGTGGWLAGMAVMAAFWVGTVPVLLGLGLGLSSLRERLGPARRAIAGSLLAVAALVSIGLRAGHLEAMPQVDEETRHAAAALDVGATTAEGAPCCDDDR
jgi:sulfite exporter TauE/SafE